MINDEIKYSKIDTRALIIIDDCLTKKDFDDEFIKELIHEGVKLNITFILTIQYPFILKYDLRKNFDYIFLLKNNSNQERIFEYFGNTIFDNFLSFQKNYNEMTENYGCMVLTNCSESNAFCDRVSKYKIKSVFFESNQLF